jgi:hypothetical protein
MKRLLPLLTLSLAGCCCGPYYTMTPVPYVQGDPRPSTSQQIVINNTDTILDVLVDGVNYSKHLETGQSVPVPARVFYGKTVVVVLGYTRDGTYVGTDHWTFCANSPEVWQVNSLQRPAESRPAYR